MVRYAFHSVAVFKQSFPKIASTTIQSNSCSATVWILSLRSRCLASMINYCRPVADPEIMYDIDVRSETHFNTQIVCSYKSSPRWSRAPLSLPAVWSWNHFIVSLTLARWQNDCSIPSLFFHLDKFRERPGLPIVNIQNIHTAMESCARFTIRLRFDCYITYLFFTLLPTANNRGAR